MWMLFAFGSAFFAGITAILAKCGMKNIDSTVATAVRTVVVLIFSWFLVVVMGGVSGVTQIDGRTMLFLICSGMSTGVSWLCYFAALKWGSVNRVTPIDKSSTVLAMILGSIFLRESIGVGKIIATVCIGVGTFLMIQRTNESGGESVKSKKWLWMAFASALFAALTSLFGKMGMKGIDSNLGTAIRTVVVLVMAWLLVILRGKVNEIKMMDLYSMKFILLSGVATGASWLCYFRALQDGPVSVVVPVDKLSILVTIAFSCIVLKEKISRRSAVGLLLIISGTMILVFI